MSNNLPTTVKTTDMTDTELVKVNEFMEEGLPGIAKVNDTQLYRMYDLYLTGSTYTQIASILGLKKVIVLYFAHKSNWYTSKIEYNNEIQEKIKSRVVESKLRSHEFILLLVQAWQKKIGLQLTRFLSTNDDQHMEDLDLKEVSQLMKAIEMVNDLDNTGKDSKGKSPAIGLNVGNGVTIEKSGDNKISITPNETNIGDVLKEFADSKREEERKKLLSIQAKHDINNNIQGEKDEI